MNSIIKEWGESYCLSALKELNKKIQEEWEGNLKFSRIESSINDSVCSWLISSVTKCTWEKYEFMEIDEIVISVSLFEENDLVKLSADVSLGDGEILYEINSTYISLNNLTITMLSNTFEEKLNQFFKTSFDYFSEGVKTICSNSK